MAQEGMAVLSYVDISPQFINFNQIRTAKWVGDRHAS